jgi:hypothetical protein
MPGSASSNADRVSARLRKLADSLRFSGGTVGDTGLGRDMSKAIGVGIADRSLQGVAPDGNAWPENQGDYGERKRARGLPVGVGLKGKRKRSTSRPMLSLVELQGVIEITDEGRTLIVKYGTGEDVRRKGQWFSGGSTGADGCEASGAKGQPPRKFYGLDDEIRATLRGLAREHLRRVVQRLRGA